MMKKNKDEDLPSYAEALTLETELREFTKAGKKSIKCDIERN